AVELRGIDAGGLALGERGGRGQSRPATGMRSPAGTQRGRPFRWRQLGTSRPPGRRRPRRDARRPSVTYPGKMEARLALDAGELGGAHHAAELTVAGAVAGQQTEARA